jgi:hypothetical protein
VQPICLYVSRCTLPAYHALLGRIHGAVVAVGWDSGLGFVCSGGLGGCAYWCARCTQCARPACSTGMSCVMLVSVPVRRFAPVDVCYRRAVHRKCSLQMQSGGSFGRQCLHCRLCTNRYVWCGSSTLVDPGAAAPQQLAGSDESRRLQPASLATAEVFQAKYRVLLKV